MWYGWTGNVLRLDLSNPWSRWRGWTVIGPNNFWVRVDWPSNTFSTKPTLRGTRLTRATRFYSPPAR